MNRIRSSLYFLARLIGDINALKSPKKMARRVKNKIIGRSLFRRLMK